MKKTVFLFFSLIISVSVLAQKEQIPMKESA